MIGIDSMDFEKVLGRQVTRSIIANSPVSLEDFGLK
jgi:hypothetical protein